MRVDRALEGGLNLGRSALDYLLKETTNKATQLALTLCRRRRGAASSQRLESRRRAGGRLRGGAVHVDRRRARGRAASAARRATPEPPPAQALRRARLQQTYRAIEQTADARARCCASSCRSTRDDRLEPLKLLQVIEPVPRALSQDDREGAGRLPRLPGDLVLARGAEAPLRADADADAAARAHLRARPRRRAVRAASRRRSGCSPKARARSRRATSRAASRCTSRDELGVLTESFNTMTAQLAEAQQKTEEVATRDRDDARLSRKHPRQPVGRACSRSTTRYRLRTANPSAAVILQQPLADLTGVPLADWGKRLPALAPFAELVGRGLSRRAATASGRSRPSSPWPTTTRTLLMRGIAAAGDAGRRATSSCSTTSPSWSQAQRDAAWARGRAPPRARDQESADADPAFGRAPRGQARAASSTAADAGDADARHADDRRAGGAR